VKAIILAGGKGTRLAEETGIRPKPMVEIGNKPILWHILKTFEAHRVKDFVVAAGYRGEMIVDYFRNFSLHSGDITFNMRTGDAKVHTRRAPDWNVTVAWTGLETMTGGRLLRVKDLVGDERFMLTYGDGLSDVDITKLLKFHAKHGKLATLTAVRPPSRFGNLQMKGDRVERFAEKTKSDNDWINGGYMVLEPEVFDYLDDDATILERSPMEKLAKEGQLMAYRHDGFWQPMDNIREKMLLEDLWESGKAPWKVWEN
jgi:glucose-1-phosphate cytidylyltransferase